jgi:cell division protein FtsB
MIDAEKVIVQALVDAEVKTVAFIATLKDAKAASDAQVVTLTAQVTQDATDKATLQASVDALNKQVADLTAASQPDPAFDKTVVDATNALTAASQ